MADELVVDLSQYKDRVGARVPAGLYRVQVEDAEQDQSRSGNTMVNVWLRIVGGEYDGQTILDRLTMTEKAMFRVVAFLQAVNIPTPKKRIKIDLDKIKGRNLDIEVEDGEPFNGRVKSEVRNYIMIPKGEQSGSGGADLDSGEDEPGDDPSQQSGSGEPIEGLGEFAQGEPSGDDWPSTNGQQQQTEDQSAGTDPETNDLEEITL